MSPFAIGVLGRGVFYGRLKDDQPRTMTPKTILAIGAGYGAGIWFAAKALKKHALLRRARAWSKTRGTILVSEVYFEDVRKKTTNYRIHYEFCVQNMMEGSTPRIAGDWFWNRKQQAAFVARFAPGQKVDVFYDSKHPNQNCLDRTDTSGVVIMWILAIGGTVLASLLVSGNPSW